MVKSLVLSLVFLVYTASNSGIVSAQSPFERQVCSYGVFEMDHGFINGLMSPPFDRYGEWSSSFFEEAHGHGNEGLALIREGKLVEAMDKFQQFCLVLDKLRCHRRPDPDFCFDAEDYSFEMARRASEFVWSLYRATDFVVPDYVDDDGFVPAAYYASIELQLGDEVSQV